MNELISVIIPVHNAERTLSRCLDSVLAQTHKAIEVICIADGDYDGSIDIINNYANHDARVKLIEQAGSGPATARNAGLEIASGDYIGFVDADDYVNPKMYKTLLSLIHKAAPAELANCGHVSFYSDSTGTNVEKSVSARSSGVAIINNTDDLGRMITDLPDFIWDKLFDAQIIREHELRFPDGRVYGEDTVFLLKYLRYVGKAVFTDEPLYHYNALSEGSITNTVSDRWYDIFENLKDILHYFREQMASDEFNTLKPYLEALCIRYYDRRVNAMIRHSEKGFQMRYVKYSFDFLTQNFPDWRTRMRKMPGILFPKVKTSLFLMRLYILAPGALKRRYAERLSK